MIRLVVFLMVLDIFNNESVDSTFKNKLEYKFEYKLGGFNTHIAQNIAETCQKYFQSFIAIETL